MYDAIVVGARVAGASTAMLLARHGASVLLVDRAAFGSEIPRGHFIHRHGPGRLQRWGLLDPLLATGCPAVTSIVQDFGDFPLVGTDIVADGVPLGLGPRRAQLDRVLVEAAVAAGAEFRERFVVDEYLGDGDGITGIRGRAVPGGEPVTEHATVVVGADGRNSALARTVRAPAEPSLPTVACWYFSYWSGVAATGLEMYVRPGRAIFAFPTNDDLFAVFVGWPIGDLPAVRADVDGSVMAAVDGVPELAERVRAGRREERLLGVAQLPNILRRPQGPGWALVGDAGCHKDPFMALGCCDALRDAELLADALVDGLGGRAPLGDALPGYEQRRNGATLPDFHANFHAAHLGPPPAELLEVRAALRDNPAATREFFLGRVEDTAGRIPPPPVPAPQPAP
jgi:flavin-dependent dehydrogenase